MSNGVGAQRRQHAGYWFLWAVSIPVVYFLALAAAENLHLLAHPNPGTLGDLVLWTLVVAAVGLFPVPVSKRLHLNLNYPILLAIAILYPPTTAASVALVGSSDPREL